MPNITIPVGIVDFRDVFSLCIRKQKIINAKAEKIYVSSIELSNKCEVPAPNMDAKIREKVVLFVRLFTISQTRKTHAAPASELRT